MMTTFRTPGLVSFAFALGTMTIMTPTALWAGPLPAVAHVDDELRITSAYTMYAKMLVQIDLIANPRTASCNTSVMAVRAGSLILEGTVPTAGLRDYIEQNAQRITGLSIENMLTIGEVPPVNLISARPMELEAEVRDTITGFYPNLADSVRVTVTDTGIVELHGEVTNYETKLNVSRLVKSQQGSRAVINLLRVPADPDTGLVQVSEDGTLTLEANRLPIIPAAPIVSIDEPAAPAESFRSGMAMAADDAPIRRASGIKLVEDARAIIERDADLAIMELELDAQGDDLVVSGRVDSRAQVELIVDRLADVPDIHKITVKARPYSMQRTMGATHSRSTGEEDTDQKSWLSWINPLASGEPDDPVESAQGWRFRSSLRRSINRQCDGRVDQLKVSATGQGILIEGEVATARDRAFVLKQIDNNASIRAIPTDIVLRIESE